MRDAVVHQAFFCLLQAGLWNKAIATLGSFPLTKTQWQDVFVLTMQHTVDGIVYDGLQKLPNDLLPPKLLLFKWTARVDAIERRNGWMDTIIAQQVAFFQKNGTQPVLLKGQGLAACYENPKRRVCGDIDWYFQDKAQRERLFHTLTKRGIEVEHAAGFSYHYMWNDCETEHQSRMIDLHNPFSQRYIRQLEMREANKQTELPLANVTVKTPSPLMTFVQVNAHILKHLLSFGIGIRQFCDSARICLHYKNKIDGNELKAVYKRLGILRWVHLLHAILVKQIGLAEDDLPFPLPKNVQADWMLDEIMAVGNFGFHDSRVDLTKEHETNHRVDSFKRLSGNFMRYVNYAPMEAISFPFVQFYSRFKS
ncbi:nucleotidyltransferase family protein [Sphingobacterium oryzagri]|uniref:Nucleotidyltransferase family protein n=1 Tax=Sphingobacterium oryzagri TaxID=3025669 RepID=A0ABY7WFP6_9SPHI|nr:nucleotidyltransferase family protein [Sphingobacterium sp. KACC 22765]WDF68342.1 nucleotidyltransferase family protein [Sphingobacterium sp. KACC 22765]